MHGHLNVKYSKMVKQNASSQASFLQVSHLSYRIAKAVKFIYDFSIALSF